MKKTNKLYFVLVIVVAILFLTGCFSEREPINRADFITTMETAGFEIVDISGQYDWANYVILAVSPGWDYQIEFYELASESDARRVFNGTREQVESGSGSSSSHTSVSVANYQRFTMTSGGLYAHLYQVGNTIIFVDWTDSEFRDEIRDLVGQFEN